MHEDGLKVLVAIGSVILIALLIHWAFDTWQATVNIYASGCETPSGRQLPAEMCKYIVHCRYQQGE